MDDPGLERLYVAFGIMLGFCAASQTLFRTLVVFLLWVLVLITGGAFG